MLLEEGDRDLVDLGVRIAQRVVLAAGKLDESCAGRRLREPLERIGWHGEQRLLVSLWEERVLSSLSSQIWIPPRAAGPPVVEGLCEQALEGLECRFVGTRPAEPPPHVERQVVDRSWLLARLFQELGYVGRCSFDTIVVGRSLDEACVRFIECNGRWGGSSAPMTPSPQRSSQASPGSSCPLPHRVGSSAVPPQARSIAIASPVPSRRSRPLGGQLNRSG